MSPWADLADLEDQVLQALFSPHHLRARAGLEADILYMHRLQPPLSLVSPWLHVGAQPCVIPALWSPPQLSVSIFHKLRSLVLSSAGEEKDQNQLDLTLTEQRSLSAMIHVRRDNTLSFLFFSPSSFPLSFCRVDGCYHVHLCLGLAACARVKKATV